MDNLQGLGIADYDPRWPNAFAEEAERIRAALGTALVGLEHVGSTAVPGLPAKPVIDILGGLARPLSNGDEDALRRLGYVSRRRMGRGRRYFRKGNPRTHYLHVVDWDSAVWRSYVDLRDFLRANADAAASYAELKRAAAARARSSRGTYASEKARFLRTLRASPRFAEFRARR